MSYVNGPSLVELHVESAAARVVVALAGHALVGRRRGGAAPRTVEVEAWIVEEGRIKGLFILIFTSVPGGRGGINQISSLTQVDLEL